MHRPKVVACHLRYNSAVVIGVGDQRGEHLRTADLNSLVGGDANQQVETVVDLDRPLDQRGATLRILQEIQRAALPLCHKSYI